MNNTGKYILLLAVSLTGLLFSCHFREQPSSEKIDIQFWYGDYQSFGQPGLAQKWINILGTVHNAHGIRSLFYQLNDRDTVHLNWGQDNHRLSGKGDFNIDIHINAVKEGENVLHLFVADSTGMTGSKTMSFDFVNGRKWPLPYHVQWNKVDRIQDVVQIVDGRWALTREGIRIRDPWYDRVIAMGDTSWKNYLITTSVIFHGYTSPVKGPPNYGVSHVALASRWPGHDIDPHQPHRKWYPLGATCEFQLKDDLDSCRWRILGDRHIREEDTSRHFSIELGATYWLKSSVENYRDSLTRYRVKIWPFDDAEPDGWDLTALEGKEDQQSGSALIIAHNSDVTFGDIDIQPLK